jgi:restriction endonuclease S subunit
VADYVRGLTYSKGDEAEQPTPNAVLRAQNVSLDESRLVLDDLRYLRPDFEGSAEKRLRADDILVCSSSGSKAHLGKVAFVLTDMPYFFGGFMGALRSKRNLIEPRFLFRILTSSHHKAFLAGLTEGANINNLKLTEYLEYEIPLPPLDEQRRIVTEIEGYQKILGGARQILAGYKPKLEVEPDWEMQRLGDVLLSMRNGCDVEQGDTPAKFRVSRIQSIADGTFNPDKTKWTNDTVAEGRFLEVGDILLSHINSEPHLAKTALFRGCSERVIHGINLLCLRPNREIIVPDFLAYWLKQEQFIAKALTYAKRAVNQASITGTDLKGIEVPLPPLEEQRRIVAELDAEAAQMDAVRSLIPRFEAKIQRVLERVWVNNEPD